MAESPGGGTTGLGWWHRPMAENPSGGTVTRKQAQAVALSGWAVAPPSTLLVSDTDRWWHCH
ncbi:unnamed protein product [Musa textilis]